MNRLLNFYHKPLQGFGVFMSRYHSYINSAKTILEKYNGDEPFASFLKKYFSGNRKYGSKDRKQISNLCYCFFRLGKSVMNVSFEEKILTALFLCSGQPNEILAALKPEWNGKIDLSIEEKCSMLNAQFSTFNVFPWIGELSKGIEYEKFVTSFFIQPHLFLRLRSGKEKVVKEKLEKAGIQFEVLSDTCLALSNALKIDTLIELDNEAVIQDYSSQRTGQFFKPAIDNMQPVSLWDCCAASGGKSIMAYDINSGINLTVSDVRESILANLKKRFEKAGIKNYKSFIADLTNPNFQSLAFDLQPSIILADVPCSGSGTWSRTPEQLYYFNENKIDEYAALQRKIVSNVIPHLQPGGSFIYITCSVFKKENEEVVDFIKEKFHLQLKQMELLKGYDKKADSMFIAVLNLPKN